MPRITDLPSNVPSDNSVLMFDTDTAGAKTSKVAYSAIKQLHSNANLLDNGWFWVNQRNVTSAYITSAGGYFVDRWRCAIAQYTVNADHTITLATSQPSCRLIQKLENWSELNGTQVTLSILMADDTMYTGTAIIDTSAEVQIIQSTTIDALLSADSTGIYIISKQASATFKAVKLELGTVSTLANDVAPDYATELLKCQRYCIAYGPNQANNCIASGYMHTTTQARLVMSLPVTMRAVPTISYSDLLIMSANMVDVSSIAVGTSAASDRINTLSLNANTASALTQNTAVLLRLKTSASYLILSADL